MAWVDNKWIKSKEVFPIEISKLDIKSPKFADMVESARDAVVFLTAVSGTRGYGGHSGGPYDIVPEMLILDALRKNNSNIFQSFFDAAGHRVAAHYLLSAMNDFISYGDLLHYREPGMSLPGHPERYETPGIDFSSGRLGHKWSYVNGISLLNPGKKIIMFDSDGSLQEGRSMEAARTAGQLGLPIKIFVDDNNTTIEDKPSVNMPHFDLVKILAGHGIKTRVVGDDYKKEPTLEEIHKGIVQTLADKGPSALFIKRPMAPGLGIVEGTNKAHDVVATQVAIDYLEKKGQDKAVRFLKAIKKSKTVNVHLGSSEEKGKPRDHFGKVVSKIISEMDNPNEKVVVVNSDLGGSCGLHHLEKDFGRLADGGIFVPAGISESNNFSLAAGFGSQAGVQGIFGTFSAFSEMVISEIRMAELNQSNVLAHFSHTGVADMADNNSHFGVNIMFEDGQIGDCTTRMYMFADNLQLEKGMRKIFNDPGVRFVHTSRAAVPTILKEDGGDFFGPGYSFEPGKDEIIRKGKGYVISYGDSLHRALDAVDRLRAERVNVGLINKPTLNIVDEDTMQMLKKASFVLLVETQNIHTGVGSHFGNWMLERDITTKYRHMGVTKLGEGGLDEQILHQGLDAKSILMAIKKLT